ncbi:MAG TPA: hypothetical protein VL241_04540 [Gemmatimonadales bacterium]|nr:hypothetical protein [Gemmatimonadales bacterium]
MDALAGRLPLVYAALAVLVALLPTPRRRALGGSGLGLLALATAAERVAPQGDLRFHQVNFALAAAGILLVLLAPLARGPADRIQPAAAAGTAPRRSHLLLPTGLLLAVLAPHLLLVGLGAALAVGWASANGLRAHRTLALAVLLFAAGCLGTALALMLIISGPLGGRLAGLAEAPFSLAAERLLTLLLGSALLLLSGATPFVRLPWRVALAPLAAALLLRLVAPLFPEGLRAWQAPAMLLLAIGVTWSVWRRAWPEAAIAGGLLALWSGFPEATLPGSVLVGWGWVVDTGATAGASRGVRMQPRWAGLMALPAGLAALPALTAGLRAQVLIPVLAVLGVVSGLLGLARLGAQRKEAPLY